MIKRLKTAKEQIKSVLNECNKRKDRLEYLYESRSERWQESEKGEEVQDKINYLDDAIFELEDVESSIDTAIECLTEL